MSLSDRLFLVTTTVNTPPPPLLDGTYAASIAQSEQSGFGPISYCSIAALISLRRRSQAEKVVLRLPSEKRKGSGKGRMIGSCSKVGKTGFA